MHPPIPFEIQWYEQHDYAAVLRLMRHAARAHVHFDWQTPDECLEDPGVVVCLGTGESGVVAVLGMSSAQERTSWLRIVAMDQNVAVSPTVNRLWGCAAERLRAGGVRQVFVILQDAWLSRSLLPLGFVPVDEVVTMRRDGSPAPPAAAGGATVQIEAACAADIPAIDVLDTAAFEAHWQLNPRELQAAWRQAELFLAAWHAGQLVGYAIATKHGSGGHLARLATLPAAQGQGVGSALLRAVVTCFEAQGAAQITVNTQGSNLISQRLYARFGFEPTTYNLPVMMTTL